MTRTMASVRTAVVAVFAVAWLSPATAQGSCDGAQTTLDRTQRALSEGRVSAALQGLSSLEEQHPDCVPAILLRAQVAAARGDERGAESLYLRATELAPERPEPFFDLGVFYDGRQQHRRAAAQFRNVIDLSPSDPQAWDYLALSLEGAGDFDKAESAYRMGLGRNRGPRFDPMLHYNYGRFLMKMGRLTEAEKHLDEAVRLVPGTRAVHFERARLAESLADMRRALVHGKRALATPDARGVILDMQVHYLLARVHQALGNTDEARRFRTLTEDAEIPIETRRSGR